MSADTDVPEQFEVVEERVYDSRYYARLFRGRVYGLSVETHIREAKTPTEARDLHAFALLHSENASAGTKRKWAKTLAATLKRLAC